MEENQKSKFCKNCANFGAYYLKGYSNFNRTKQGRCSISKSTVNNLDGCLFWRKKLGVSVSRKRNSMRVLYDLLLHISEIKQILQEEREENE